MEQFLLGFIAGEGCFGISLYQRDSGAVMARPYFQLGVDEPHIIDKIHQNMGELGGVSERANGFIEWQVQNNSDVAELRDWVETHRGEWFNTSHKADQFDLWSNAVDIRQQDEVSDDDKRRLVDIAYDIPRSNTKKLPREVWHQRIEDWESYECGAETESGGECERAVREPDITCHLH